MARNPPSSRNACRRDLAMNPSLPAAAECNGTKHSMVRVFKWLYGQIAKARSAALFSARISKDETIVLADLADLLYGTPWPTLASLAVALMLSGVLITAFSPSWVAGWLILAAIAHGERLLLWWHYRRASR